MQDILLTIAGVGIALGIIGVFLHPEPRKVYRGDRLVLEWTPVRLAGLWMVGIAVASWVVAVAAVIIIIVARALS